MEDEEAKLLAELKAISSSSDRFADDTQVADTAVRSSLIDRHSPKPSQQRDASPVLPWKKKKPPSTSGVGSGAATEGPPVAPPQPKYGIASDIPSTFTGDRGGVAEDAELLALLRGVSEKAGVSRFDDDDEEEEPAAAAAEQVPAPAPAPPMSSKPLPPWKRKRAPNLSGDTKKNDTEPIAVAAPPKYGIQPDIKSSFQGERGGAAEDAELLALLRGVSEKAGVSRFDDDASDEAMKPSPVAAIEPVPEEKRPPAETSRPLPPWKRNKPPKKSDDSAVDIVVSAPDQNATQEETSFAKPAAPKYGIQSEIPSNFTGERGGAAEDAELLALLRGVSEKAGASRFEETEQDAIPSKVEAGCETAAPPNSAQSDLPLPPWKRKKPKDATKSAGTDTKAIPKPAYGSKSEQKSTFSGEQGGEAEDAELLALLRGVSEKAGVSRFNDDDEEDGQKLAGETRPSAQQENGKIELAQSKSETKKDIIPPWKQIRMPKKAEEDNVGIIESAPPPVEPKFGIKSDLPSSFKGERGGTAEDAELLELLRGVSMKAGASRFDDDDNVTVPDVIAPSQATSPRSSKPDRVPPWKQRRPLSRQVQANDALNVPQEDKPSCERSDSGRSVSTHDVAGNPPPEPKYGIKAENASTFAGERGGRAEDAELLALLRGVSTKSSTRFDEAPSTNEQTENSAVADRASLESQRETSNERAEIPRKAPRLPPRKRNQTGHERTGEPASIQGIKSDIPSTFTGERGGKAEDEELLALLRGVSSKSSNRFQDENTEAELPSQSPMVSSEAHNSPVRKNSPYATKEAYSPPLTRSAATTSEEQEQLVTVDCLPEALLDKNWKVRAQSYELLENILRNKAKLQSGSIDVNEILPGLDDEIIKFTTESSAPAFDKALSFLILYAEHCTSAGAADRAAQIASSLLKKNAFSSRPSTLRLVSSLVLKLMEVSLDGAASVHSIVQVLVNEGFTSKKPKVVQAVVALVLDSAVHFGACTLPLASLVAGLPGLLANSNVKVRKSALMIVAELCRALGSKDPIQGLFDGMKSAQIAEIDAMLQAQPKPSKVETGLRNSKSHAKGSTKDALAALQAGSEALEAERFAARPAVDVVQAIRQSDYQKLLDMPKWSNKVAALDIVLESGGKKPYKLVQPTNSAHYGTLIADMKSLLAHTHFAVVTKALLVLSMLSSGVGEKLFSNLRPLFGMLLRLSKDKKLTRPVNETLDSFFGNILSFEQLLGGDDSLRDAVDEKKQKNELVRKTGLEFLSRCIERNTSAGPKGSLSVRDAELATDLCCKKLGDPDGSVREAAVTVLKGLLNSNDRKVVVKVQTSIDALESSNPRAYKKLSAAGESRCSPAKSLQIGKASTGNKNSKRPEPNKPKKAPQAVLSQDAPSRQKPTPAPPASSDTSCLAGIPHLEEALVHVTSLSLPKWNETLEDGGILEGLKCKHYSRFGVHVPNISFFLQRQSGICGRQRFLAWQR